MRRTRILGIGLVLAITRVAVAQPPSTETPVEDSAVDLISLEDLIRRQQKLLEAQEERLEAQSRRLEEQGRILAEQAELLRDLQLQIGRLQGQPSELSDEEIASREQMASIEGQTEAQEVEAITAGEFPGSLEIPGTNMAVRFGGFTHFSLISTLKPLGQTDRFVTATIPVTESDLGEKGTKATVNRTRLNFDWRLKSSMGEFRSFVEGDFRGEGDTFRLRHAFGQFRNLLVGQNWTTFMDPQNRPEEIDLEGLNGMVILRQPLIRWESRLRDDIRLAIALEDPRTEVTNGEDESGVPDLTFRVLRALDRGRFHASALIRQLEAAHGDLSDEAFGWGVSAGGKIPLGAGEGKDNFHLQLTLGRGIGRYVNDLRAEGGQDAVFDSESGHLKGLFGGAGFVSYQHWWYGQTRSSLSLGYTRIDNLDLQRDDAYRETRRGTVNFVWSPIPSLDIGVEFLYGVRENKNRQSESASQFQLATYFRF